MGPGIAASLIAKGDHSRINGMAATFCLISILMFFTIIHRTRHLGSLVEAAEAITGDGERL